MQRKNCYDYPELCRDGMTFEELVNRADEYWNRYLRDTSNPPLRTARLSLSSGNRPSQTQTNQERPPSNNLHQIPTPQREGSGGGRLAQPTTVNCDEVLSRASFRNSSSAAGSSLRSELLWDWGNPQTGWMSGSESQQSHRGQHRQTYTSPKRQDVFADLDLLDKESLRDTRTLAEMQEEKEEAEKLNPWERYLVFPPENKFPYPKKCWEALLSGEAVEGLSMNNKLEKAYEKKRTGERGSEKKRKRPEDLDVLTFRPHLPISVNGEEPDWRACEPLVIDSFGVNRSASYYSYLAGEIDSEEEASRHVESILFKNHDREKEEMERKSQEAPKYSSWFVHMTPEDLLKVRAPFDGEAMRRAARVSKQVVVEKTNKRQRIAEKKVEEKKETPTGFRSTSIYKAIRAVIKFVFAKNS